MSVIYIRHYIEIPNHYDTENEVEKNCIWIGAYFLLQKLYSLEELAAITPSSSNRYIYQDTHNDIMPRTYCDVGIHNFLFFCDITRYSHDNNDLMTKQATDKVFLTSSLNGRVYTSHLLKKKMLTMWFQRNELTNSHNSRIIMMPNIAEYFNLSHQYILHH